MTTGINTNLFTGTSGLVLPITKKMFPAEFQTSSRLSYYASLFNSLEINSSFYKIPMGSTVARWADEVPNDFRFTFKLWKGITHNKQLEFKQEDVIHFLETINNAGNKKGSLLIQFPPSCGAENMPQLKKLLKCIQKGSPGQYWQTAVEFRNVSWYTNEVYNFLNKNNIGLVMHDHPSSITPSVDIKPSFVYLRFHGVKGDYRGTYTDEQLAGYAAKVRVWLNEGKTAYIYFNNTMGEALNNLVSFNRLVNSD